MSYQTPGYDYEQWSKPKIVARIWECGDPYCECSQPLVELIEPNMNAGYPWITRKRLWEGTFVTSPNSEEAAKVANELEQAAADVEAGKYNCHLK